MRIVFLDRDTIGPAVDLTRPGFAHDWVAYDRTPPEKVAERIADADIVITNKAPVRGEALSGAKNLKMISVAATGYDIVDVAACKARGIIVANVRAYAVETVPEHTFALILALRRSIVGYRQDVLAGKWQEAAQFCFFTHPIRNLAGATLGIIGEGAIGQSVAKIGQAFGMRTLFAAHKNVSGLGPLYTPFDQVLEESDILTLHCPLTPQTRNTLAMAEFRKMKKRPLIINTARGGLVDEADLVAALDQGLVSGIGFDCLTSEPPRPDNPLMAIADRPNVIITPHVAWASDEAMQALWAQVVGNIEAFAAGRPRHVVSG